MEDPHNLNEDGVPIVGAAYGQANANNQDTEGLRVYDAFFQEDNSRIPMSRHEFDSNDESAPILPHHRQSASWVERSSRAADTSVTSRHNLNAHFDDRVYRESYPSPSSRSSAAAIDLPLRNRAKYTVSMYRVS